MGQVYQATDTKLNPHLRRGGLPCLAEMARSQPLLKGGHHGIL